MVRYERLVNNAETTLSSSLTAGATSVSVADGSVFPDEGDYRLVVDSEIMLCTARSGNTLTVIRGVDGSTAAAHDSGKAIAAIVTQTGLDRWAQDFLDPYCLERQNRLMNESGTILTSSSFTTANAGTSTVYDESDGTITIAIQQRATPNFVALYKSAPSTPYTLTAHIATGPCQNDSGDIHHGIGFRESSSSKISWVNFQHYGNCNVQYLADWNDATGAPAASTTFATSGRHDYWLRIEDDGTDTNYYSSGDGYHWYELLSEVRGTWFDTGPNEIWWGGQNNAGDGNEMIHLFAWIEE